MSSKMSRKFDVVVFGSTGFTGQLTAQYLANSYPDLKIAIVGRNIQKLNFLKGTLNEKVQPSVSIVEIKDMNDGKAVDDIVQQSKVVISTAGPYAKVGGSLVDSCVRCSTHYCDITGEPQFVANMVNKHHTSAKNKNIKIVHCCGFDSIPSDLGAMMIVAEMKKRSLKPLEVRFIVDQAKGGISGGTIASVLNLIASHSTSELKKLSNPYFVCPEPNALSENPKLAAANADINGPRYDSVLNMNLAPFIMQSVNTRIVHRSNMLSGYSYGKNVIYTEGTRVPSYFVATISSFGFALFGVLAFFPFTRALLGVLLPKPGQGPTEEQQKTGCFHIKLWGKGLKEVPSKNGSSTSVEEIVYGVIDAPNGDPGYSQTSKMLAECAMCMVYNEKLAPKEYGVITPSIAFGTTLLDRLKSIGIDFYIKSPAVTAST